MPVMRKAKTAKFKIAKSDYQLNGANRLTYVVTVADVGSRLRLAVIAVIALLASLVLPAASKATARTRATACLSNLRQVGTSLRLYLDENANRFPIMLNRSKGGGTAPTTNATRCGPQSPRGLNTTPRRAA